MGLAKRIAGLIAAAILWLLILALLAITIVPAFLDRIYYEGPPRDHFDGARFHNPDGEPIPGLSGPRGGVLTRFIPGRTFARAPWPDHVAIRPIDARRLPPLKAGEMRAIWVGHATVLIQVPGLNVLTDPIWSDVAGPFGIGPHRVMAPGIPFDDLPHIDIVVVSHNHYDHLDLATLRRLWDRDRPLIVTALGNDRLMASRGIKAVGLDWGQTARADKVRIHVTRNHHWSSRWFVDRDRALWSAFVIETPSGNVFFAGDTGPGDMHWPAEARRWGPIRLALLPIGAFRFVPHQMVNGAHIGPREAVKVFGMLDAAAGIPIHWGTFRLSAEAWGTPVAMLDRFNRCDGIDPARFHGVRPGVPVMVPAKPSPRIVHEAGACEKWMREVAAMP
jgi:L-ascorbate metabolism protein UlaG (beta-lactamase superfamily)